MAASPVPEKDVAVVSSTETVRAAPSPSSTTSAAATASGSQKKSWLQGIASSFQHLASASTTPLASPPPSSAAASSNTPTAAAVNPPRAVATVSQKKKRPPPAILRLTEEQVVLYYCSCLINGGSLPGYLYLTKDYLLFTSSIFNLLNSRREVYSLAALHTILTAGEELLAVSSGDSFVFANPPAGSMNPSTTTAAGNQAQTGPLRLLFRVKKNKKQQEKELAGNGKEASVNQMTEESSGSIAEGAAVQSLFKEVLVAPITIDAQKLKTVILEVKSQFSAAL